jgi:hypothetical protein
MDDLILDWICLFTQIVILIILIIQEITRRTSRNLYAILIFATMLILVQGQAWWILEKFQNGNSTTVIHLFQSLSLEGTQLANLYAGLCVISLAITYKFMAKHKLKKPLFKKTIKNLPNINHVNWFLTNIIITGLVILFSILLIILLGGLQAAIDNPGNVVGGQTFLLIGLSLGKMPLLHKLSFKEKINFFDFFLFSFTFFLTLFNSRFTAIFMLGQVILIFNYCKQEISRRWILIGGFILIMILLGFGLYRDNSTANIGLSFLEKVDLLLERFNQNETPIEWFYRSNVEGFVGLAGILTYESQYYGIVHDFGLSNLILLTQLIPNNIRNNVDYIQPLLSFFESSYPYPEGSVVPSGIETSYAHFGVIGIILLGVLLGYLADYLHKNMILLKEEGLQFCLISVQSVNLIRTMLRNVLFFGIADLVITYLYRLILSIGKKA